MQKKIIKVMLLFNQDEYTVFNKNKIILKKSINKCVYDFKQLNTVYNIIVANLK